MTPFTRNAAAFTLTGSPRRASRCSDTKPAAIMTSPVKYAQRNPEINPNPTYVTHITPCAQRANRKLPARPHRTGNECRPAILSAAKSCVA